MADQLTHLTASGIALLSGFDDHQFPPFIYACTWELNETDDYQDEHILLGGELFEFPEKIKLVTCTKCQVLADMAMEMSQ